MVTVHALGDGPWSTWLRSLTGGGDWVVFAKGAVEVILGLSSQVWTAHGPSPLDESARMDILARHELLAGEGMRVLGVAFSALREPPEKYVPTHGLIFVGMVGMADSLRPEASDALCTCRKAGIRVLLVTGDHPATALRVARQLELDAAVLTGADLESMTVEELARRVEEVTVYARVSPEHKPKIVDALRKRGQVVAMTGDDVNDAPALRRADIGVAMGRIGTDAAREAADLVLLDDNFATIVAAIREGRVIYDNIRKK